MRLKRLAKLQSSTGSSPAPGQSSQALDPNSVRKALDENVTVTPQPSVPITTSSSGGTPTKQGIYGGPTEVSLSKKARVSPPEVAGSASGSGKGVQTLESWEDRSLGSIFRITLQVRIDTTSAARVNFCTNIT